VIVLSGGLNCKSKFGYSQGWLQALQNPEEHYRDLNYYKKSNKMTCQKEDSQLGIEY
jgi:hypothetical protein